ncbi:MAG: hypothetical protein FWJ93_08175 [Micromonosporaceae bacterium]
MRKVHAVDTLGHAARRLRGLISRRPSLSHTPKQSHTPKHLRRHGHPTHGQDASPGRGTSPAPVTRTSRRLIIGAALGFLAFATAVETPPPADRGPVTASVLAAEDRTTDERAAAARASRGEERSPAPTPSPREQTSEQPKRPEPPKPPAKPKPVAWLNQAQMDNAEVIVRTGQQVGLPKRAYVIAVATAIQESKLLNLANPAVPQSLRIKSQGVGYDHDSIGLFQQRPSAGWGTPAQLLDPEYASRQFYNKLAQVPGWQNMALTWAAQSVQVSAFPYAYAQHESVAQQIVDAITPYLDAVAEYEDAMAKYEQEQQQGEQQQDEQ